MNYLNRLLNIQWNFPPESSRIKWLWELLEEFTPADRRKFIKFCWAQERLPSTKDEYERLQVVFTIKPCMDKKKKDIFPKALLASSRWNFRNIPRRI